MTFWNHTSRITPASIALIAVLAAGTVHAEPATDGPALEERGTVGHYDAIKQTLIVDNRTYLLAPRAAEKLREYLVSHGGYLRRGTRINFQSDQPTPDGFYVIKEFRIKQD